MVLNNERLQDLEKEILKNHITAPQDGCKTMALGTLTVVGVYIALISNLFEKKHLIQNFWGIVGIFFPILLFIIAGFLFGLGYLPEPIDKTLAEGENAAEDDVERRKRIVRHISHTRDYLFYGVIVFWAGILSSLIFLIFYPKP